MNKNYLNNFLFGFTNYKKYNPKIFYKKSMTFIQITCYNNLQFVIKSPINTSKEFLSKYPKSEIFNI